MKFKFEGRSSFKDDPTVVTVECEHDSLMEVIMSFEQFLRGCGYHFDGEVTIQEEDFTGDTDNE